MRTVVACVRRYSTLYFLEVVFVFLVDFELLHYFFLAAASPLLQNTPHHLFILPPQLLLLLFLLLEVNGR